MASSDDALVLRADSHGVCTLTLNRPTARNALSAAMIAALSELLDQIADDDSVRVVVLAANGPAFCAGHDLKELRSLDAAATEKLFLDCSTMMMQLVRLPQPVIAKVHGIATAAGCQLVATADLAVAAKSAAFATPGVNIGLFCTTPSVAVGRAVPRKTAMEMLLTGEPITAARAEAAGLINSAVPDHELDGTVDALAKLIASKSAHILAIGKKAFYAQIEQPMADSYVYASAVMAQNMLESDCTEGIAAFIEKRAPEWG
jgi:enoyl-CoA hydratase/carnithine racemase